MLLVVAAVVPLFLFQLYYQYSEYTEDLAATGEQTLALARSMSLVVEEELAARIAALTTLATANTLAADDLDGFRPRAVTVAERQFPGANILLIAANGQVLMSTVAPPGAKLPVRSNMESTNQVFATGRPAVSNVFPGALRGRPIVAIDVPVFAANGGVRYVLSMNPNLADFAEILRRQNLPPNWLVSIIDAQNIRIARFPNAEQHVGQPAAPQFAKFRQQRREGTFENVSAEGISVISSFSSGAIYGWGVAIGVPRIELVRPIVTATLQRGAASLALLMIGLGLAVYMSRRIAGPIDSLRRLAALADGAALAAPAPTGLPEVDEVARALHVAEAERRRSREAEVLLRDAMDSIPEGFAIYDDEDRLVFCNRGYRSLLPDNSEIVFLGARFEDIMRVAAQRRHYPSAQGDLEQWVAARVREHRDAALSSEQRLADGRWILAARHRLSNGWIAGLHVDITALKAAQQALQVSEERFRGVVEAMPNAILMVSADGTIELVNAQAEKIFLYPRSELMDRPIEMLLPERYRTRHPGLRAHFFGDPGARLMGVGRDLFARRQDGGEFPVEVGLSPFDTEDGPKVLASVIDITARREAERVQAYYAAIVASSADAIIAKDLHGVVTSWNQAAERIFGYTADEMIGQPILRLLPADRHAEEETILDHIRRGERIEHFETVRQRKDGSEFPVSVTVSPILRSGEIVGASKVARDITERKRMQESLAESEERFRSIFGAVGEGIFIVSRATGRFTEVNEAGCAMFGFTRDELIGSDIEAISSGEAPYTQKDAMEWHAKAVATGDPQRFEWQCKAKDGRLFWSEVSLRSAVIGGEDAVLAIVRDITERQIVEAQLRQAQKMEAIGNLTGGMAHDFNNLLGVIVGNLDLARMELENDAGLRELVDEAHQAAWRGADLTRRLLAFARRQPLRPAQIEINNLVGDTVRLLRRLLGEDIEVSLHLGDNLWPVVADPAQLESSLANLANNARDAMPGGGRLIIATANRRLDAEYAATHPDTTPGDFVMIEVSDTGTGMSRETMSQIFEPFFTTKETGKGTGLGLSMVFGFLKQSGGHVAVYSEPGKGTTFRLYLPRAAGDELVAEVVDARPAPRGTGETVLVVEDNEGMRRVTVRQLRALGYRIFECDRAAAALDLLQSEHVDLLFTDVVMPGGLDGAELARIARERWPSLKTLLTSGFPQARVEGDGLAAMPLLSKPYHREELAAALRAALEG